MDLFVWIFIDSVCRPTFILIYRIDKPRFGDRMLMGFLLPVVKAVLAVLITLYILIPLILFCAPLVHVNLIFMNFMHWPYTNYSEISSFGVASTSRNFYLTVDDGVTLGLWHMLPKNMSAISDQDFESALSKGDKPIFVYSHGNSWSRCREHRVKMYNILSELGYHVIAYDYRGYGDSTGYPTETGMISDAINVYEWTLRRAGNNPVFLWGHSLGTAIATSAASILCSRNECPRGLVLESPFNNLTEILTHHPLSKMFRWLPWYQWFLVYPPIRYGLILNTDESIKEVKCPVLILHARDDHIIPFELAVKLRDCAMAGGVDVTFIEFDHPHHYGHKHICKAPELPDIVYEFVNKAMSQSPAHSVEIHV